MDERIDHFREILANIESVPWNRWLYLPSDEEWTLKSNAAVLEPEEVPPELEDDPEAEIPQFAKDNNLTPALDIPAVKGIVDNARAQKPDIDMSGLFNAFMYYYNNDAYIEL